VSGSNWFQKRFELARGGVKPGAAITAPKGSEDRTGTRGGESNGQLRTVLEIGGLCFEGVGARQTSINLLRGGVLERELAASPKPQRPRSVPGESALRPLTRWKKRGKESQNGDQAFVKNELFTHIHLQPSRTKKNLATISKQEQLFRREESCPTITVPTKESGNVLQEKVEVGVQRGGVILGVLIRRSSGKARPKAQGEKEASIRFVEGSQGTKKGYFQLWQGHRGFCRKDGLAQP